VFVFQLGLGPQNSTFKGQNIGAPLSYSSLRNILYLTRHIQSGAGRKLRLQVYGSIYLEQFRNLLSTGTQLNAIIVRKQELHLYYLAFSWSKIFCRDSKHQNERATLYPFYALNSSDRLIHDAPLSTHLSTHRKSCLSR
jgi:hypothetical protein